MNLGRLIRSLNKRCPECDSFLQIRAIKKTVLLRGEEFNQEEEIIQCPSCEYEEKIKNPKKRVEHFDKTKYVPEPKSMKKEREHASNKKSK